MSSSMSIILLNTKASAVEGDHNYTCCHLKIIADLGYVHTAPLSNLSVL